MKNTRSGGKPPGRNIGIESLLVTFVHKSSICCFEAGTARRQNSGTKEKYIFRHLTFKGIILVPQKLVHRSSCLFLISLFESGSLSFAAWKKANNKSLPACRAK